MKGIANFILVIVAILVASGVGLELAKLAVTLANKLPF